MFFVILFLWSCLVMLNEGSQQCKEENSRFLANYADLAIKFAPLLKFDKDAVSFPMYAEYFYQRIVKNNSYQNNYDYYCENDYCENRHIAHIPTYFQVTECRDQIRIIYYWWYGRQAECSPGNGSHIGDWERIVVILSHDRSKVAAVIYYVYNGTITKIHGRYNNDFEFHGLHPVVYVGKISHGSYPNRNYRGEVGGGCSFYADYRNPDENSYWTTETMVIPIDSTYESWFQDPTFFSPIDIKPQNINPSSYCYIKACSEDSVDGCEETDCKLGWENTTALTCLQNCRSGNCNCGSFCCPSCSQCFSHFPCEPRNFDSKRWTVPISDIDLLVENTTICPLGMKICAKEKGACQIPPRSAQHTTIAYGLRDQWVFQEFSHYHDKVLSIQCNSDVFGDVLDGFDKVCCYNPLQIFDPSMIDDDWVKTCSEGDHCTMSDNYTYLIRYGADNLWTYRLIENQFDCNNKIFGDVIHKHKDCWYLKDYIFNFNWTKCGDEKSGFCIFDQNVKKLVKYGVNDTYYYREVYSGNGRVPCQNRFFDNPGYKNKSCYVSDLGNMFISPSLLFTNYVNYDHPQNYDSDYEDYEWTYYNNRSCMVDEDANNYIKVISNIYNPKICEIECYHVHSCIYAVYDTNYRICSLFSSCNTQLIVDDSTIIKKQRYIY